MLAVSVGRAVRVSQRAYLLWQTFKSPDER